MALAVIFCFASAALSAAEFDGSRPLLSATIDFAKKTVTGPQRATPIRFGQTDENQILLQGTEFSFASTIVLDRVDGTIGVTLVNREDALVLFGACTAM
jgi:hypothetical protein